jgi:hypothetical protein
MTDYTWPSIFLANLMFFIIFGGSAYFLIRSRKDGYWGKSCEEPKYRMLEDDDDDFTERHHG